MSEVTMDLREFLYLVSNGREGMTLGELVRLMNQSPRKVSVGGKGFYVPADTDPELTIKDESGTKQMPKDVKIIPGDKQLELPKVQVGTPDWVKEPPEMTDKLKKHEKMLASIEPGTTVERDGDDVKIIPPPPPPAPSEQLELPTAGPRTLAQDQQIFDSMVNENEAAAPPPPPPAPVPDLADKMAKIVTSIEDAKPDPQTADAMGLKWDKRIHSETPTMTAKGVWRKRRGLAPGEFDRIKAELLGAPPQPSADAPTESITTEALITAAAKHQANMDTLNARAKELGHEQFMVLAASGDGVAKSIIYQEIINAG